MSKLLGIRKAAHLIGGILAIGTAAGFPHMAKSADGEPGASLEEIVVTAQRRQENIQDVPISMSAITGATLENLGLRDFNGYAALIPNLSLGVGSGAGGAGSGAGVSSARAVAIRGVAGNNTTALYVDDTPVPLVVRSSRHRLRSCGSSSWSAGVPCLAPDRWAARYAS